MILVTAILTMIVILHFAESGTISENTTQIIELHPLILPENIDLIQVHNRIASVLEVPPIRHEDDEKKKNLSFTLFRRVWSRIPQVFTSSHNNTYKYACEVAPDGSVNALGLSDCVEKCKRRNAEYIRFINKILHYMMQVTKVKNMTIITEPVLDDNTDYRCSKRKINFRYTSRCDCIGLPKFHFQVDDNAQEMFDRIINGENNLATRGVLIHLFIGVPLAILKILDVMIVCLIHPIYCLKRVMYFIKQELPRFSLVRRKPRKPIF